MKINKYNPLLASLLLLFARGKVALNATPDVIARRNGLGMFALDPRALVGLRKVGNRVARLRSVERQSDAVLQYIFDEDAKGKISARQMRHASLSQQKQTGNTKERTQAIKIQTNNYNAPDWSATGRPTTGPACRQC